MKVKFTKLAALLLAGAALFATGCTDYEVDIQKVDEKVNALTSDVNNSIAGLQQQIAGINATVATLETQAKHDKDIAALNKTISDLETALKADYEKKINDAVNILNAALADLQTQMATELDKKLDKTTFNAAKEEVEKAILAANQRIQALEDADAAFKEQIANLTEQFTKALEGLDAKITALDEKKADKTQVAEDLAKLNKELSDAIAAAKTELEKKITDLETAVNGEIATLKDRMDKAEAAIKKINEMDIPNLKKQVEDLEAFQKEAEKAIEDLQAGKLDKAEFDDYYKAAYEKYTKPTIDLMQAAIDDLAATFSKYVTIEQYDKDKAALNEALAAIVANFANYVTLEEYNAKVEEIMKKFDDYVLNSVFKEEVAKIIAMFDDYVLTETFDAFVKIAATKEEVNALEARINGQLEQLEKDLKKYADDQDAKVKEELTKYIDDKADALQDQLDVVKENITALDTRVTTLEGAVAKVVASLEFCVKEDEDGNAYYDLQGYIDNADQLLQDQIDEIWTWIDEYLIPTLNELFDDIYDQLDLLNDRVTMALQRIQSIQFVPDYDDLKITSNMSFFTAPVEILEEETGEGTNEFEMLTLAIDQPTQITYQFLPAQYAKDVADGVEEFITENPGYYRVLIEAFFDI